MVFFWHPDRCQDNERRRRFAEEKTKQINEVFDRIQSGRFDETQTEYPKQNGNQPPDPPWTPPNNPKKKSRKLVNRVVFAILACYLLLILIKPFHKRASWLEPDSQPQNEPSETTHVYPNEEPVSDPVTEPLRSPERESVSAIETQDTPPPTESEVRAFIKSEKDYLRRRARAGEFDMPRLRVLNLMERVYEGDFDIPRLYGLSDKQKALKKDAVSALMEGDIKKADNLLRDIQTVQKTKNKPPQPKEKPKPPVEKKIQPYWLNSYRIYHQRTQSTAEIAREVNLLIEKAQIEMLEAEIKHVSLTDSMLHVQDQLNRKRKAHQRHESYSGRLRVSQLDEEWLKDQIKMEKRVTRWREQGMTPQEIFDAVKSIIQKQIADHEKKYPRD